ncbi:MAG: acetylornithine transaminase [Nocardioides sp.]|jgi:acetylornithine/N-succinyldiaminopimelate aminotransferase
MTEQQTWQDRYSVSLINAFGPPKLELVRGAGAHVWDSEGNEYVDFLGGIAVNALGHAHPALVEAVTTQLKTLGHISNFFTSEPQIELAERLVGLLGAPAKVFFTNSGGEANECAYKLTRLTGRTKIVATEGAFHGRTMGALSLTYKPAYREPFAPLPGEVVFVPYGDVAALEAAVDDRTAALILEPIQGEAGVVVPPAGYLEHARKVTRDHGALLWLDEVQTGIGRTGDWFAHTRDAITPDLVTIAKGLGGGIPIGACLAVGDAAELIQPGNHGTTFGGNPVACAAALTVLDVIESEDLLTEARVKGHDLRVRLAEQPSVTDVSGAGLLLGVGLDGVDGPTFVAAAQRAGFLINATGPDRLRMAPPLVIADDDIAALIDAWPVIVESAVERSRDQGASR